MRFFTLLLFTIAAYIVTYGKTMYTSIENKIIILQSKAHVNKQTDHKVPSSDKHFKRQDKTINLATSLFDFSHKSTHTIKTSHVNFTKQCTNMQKGKQRLYNDILTLKKQKKHYKL